jgi:hypothetical protein
MTAAESSNIKLRGVPERIFVSVDQRTSSSTVSFAPQDVCAPIVRESDPQGELAMSSARAIAASYPGCAITGPHFHTSRPAGSAKPRRYR